MYIDAIAELYGNISTFGVMGLLSVSLFLAISFSIGWQDKSDLLIATAIGLIAGVLAGFHTPIWIPALLIIFVMIKKISE